MTSWGFQGFISQTPSILDKAHMLQAIPRLLLSSLSGIKSHFVAKQTCFGVQTTNLITNFYFDCWWTSHVHSVKTPFHDELAKAHPQVLFGFYDYILCGSISFHELGRPRQTASSKSGADVMNSSEVSSWAMPSLLHFYVFSGFCESSPSITHFLFWMASLCCFFAITPHLQSQKW